VKGPQARFALERSIASGEPDPQSIVFTISWLELPGPKAPKQIGRDASCGTHQVCYLHGYRPARVDGESDDLPVPVPRREYGGPVLVSTALRERRSARGADPPRSGRRPAGYPALLMSGTRAAFSDGLSAMAPLLVGIVPFGLIFGIAAVESGVGPAAGIGLSVLVFAGAAQLATVELIGADTAPVVVVATALVINASHLMYSASLAPHFAGLGKLGRVGIAYGVTDQAYALSITEFGRRPMRPAEKVAFFMGATAALWLTWQVCTIIGIAVGASVPEAWSLDFAVPLVFLALLIPAVADRSSAAAAAAAGAAAALAAGLPFNLGVMIGAVTGVAAGVVTERLLPLRREEG